jgi:hypothetical protein
MTRRVQVERSSVNGDEITSTQVGSLFVNLADLKIQVRGSAGPVDLLPIRPFSTLSSYVAGDIVVYSGSIYVADGAISPGAFDVNDWTELVAGTFYPFIGANSWDFTISYDGGLLNEIVYSKADFRLKQEIAYDGGVVDTVTYSTSINAGGLYTPAGTLTLSYTDGDITGGAWS